MGIRSRKVLALVLATAVASCGTEGADTGKAPITDLPASISTKNSKRALGDIYLAGTALVGQNLAGRLNSTGWFAVEVELSAGPIDIATFGYSDLDTVLFLVGPKKDDYDSAPVVAIADDASALNSDAQIATKVPADGTYAVIVTSYLNYVFYPEVRDGEGDFDLSIRCPLGADACGPAVLGTGASCYADNQCSPGHSCVGELTCPPFTECVYTSPGRCTENTFWLAFEPTQCGTSPWLEGNEAFSSLASQSELPLVYDYFDSRGVDILEAGFMWPAQSKWVCAGCECPRGDLLFVRASAFDSVALVEDHGFRPIADGTTFAAMPRYCAANPWQGGIESASSLDEAVQVLDWLNYYSLEPAYLGFAYPRERESDCRGCVCPRGDRLIVVPPSAERESLPLLGLDPLYPR